MIWPGNLSQGVRQYLLVTANYWVFTLTDGALRMLVVLYFYDLGYSPLNIALLFIFYEIFGVITNLFGGWLGARLGLNKTMNVGLFLQIIALSMLLLPSAALSILWVMAAQALSGIAKDLNKMSAKSAIKFLVPSESSTQPMPSGRLFKWVALLTGSKNALKGAGFFLGGALLSLFGFQLSVLVMTLALIFILIVSLIFLNKDFGRAKNKPKFTEVFSKNASVNILSAARLFLFASRDVWFVIALPVFLSGQFGWGHSEVGGFLAIWIIGYGLIQSIAPKVLGDGAGKHQAVLWAFLLSILPAFIALAVMLDWHVGFSILAGLALFAVVFAVNSSLHSYLIVRFARDEGASLDVGFYYMANALGRLLGTVLSGWLFQGYGLVVCLWVSALSVLVSALISLMLPIKNKMDSV